MGSLRKYFRGNFRANDTYMFQIIVFEFILICNPQILEACAVCLYFRFYLYGQMAYMPVKNDVVPIFVVNFLLIQILNLERSKLFRSIFKLQS